MKISRRDFLKSSTASTAALTLSGGNVEKVFGAPAAITPGPGNKWPGRVVINYNGNALTGTTSQQSATMQKMVDDAICKLTDQTTVAAAWQALFPSSLTATSKIAIKVPLGCAQTPCFPQVPHVQAMVNGLRSMTINGAPFTGTITIYECATPSCGNNLNAFGYNSTNFPNATVTFDSIATYSDAPAGNPQYSTILHNADFLINVFSPRGHSSFGVTLGFKNHFGSFNPNILHNGGIETVNATGPVFKKTVLFMCSAIYANKENNGPGQSATNYNTYAKTIDPNATGIGAYTLILTTDPITADMQAMKIMRLNTTPAGGILPANMPSYLQNSAGLGSNIANIGIINESQMDKRSITTLTGAVNISNPKQGRTVSANISATHVNGHSSTLIEYTLPSNHVDKDVLFEIYDMKGNMVRELSDKPTGTLSQFSWNERNGFGNLVRSGNYIVRLISGSTQMATQLSIMR